MNWERVLDRARSEVARTLASLPPDLHERAKALPVTYERVPGAAVLQDGEESNELLGLFVGGEFAAEEHVPLPAQIILYLENIWDMVEGNEEEFCDEVRITFLHELGHYLGLDEDDLDERGLL
jgi:predicted Zn-dependent protease with MMP-like domain